MLLYATLQLPWWWSWWKMNKYTCRHHHHIHCQRHFLIVFSHCALCFLNNNIMHLHSILWSKSGAAYFTGELDDGIHRQQCSYFMRQLAESGKLGDDEGTAYVPVIMHRRIIWKFYKSKQKHTKHLLYKNHLCRCALL